MSDFYKILKDTRIEKNIGLEEIHNRTKISLRFLQAIEQGNFEILPGPYVRLFLRAYSKEIGLNPEKLLNEYNALYPIKALKNREKEKIETSNTAIKTLETTNKKSNQKTKKKYKNNRDTYLKAGVALLIYCFGLFVLSAIYNSRESEKGDVFSIAKLNTDYIKGDMEEHQLNILPPYSLKIVTMGELCIYDVSNTHNKKIILNSGDYKSFLINDSLKVVIEHTQNVGLSISGSSEVKILDEFQNSSTPLKVKITTKPPTFSIRRYTPISQ